MNKATKLSPLNGVVVLKRVEEEEQSFGNIVIPDMGKERPEICEVVEVSDTYNWHTSSYKSTCLTPGQKVLIPKMGAMQITLDGIDYVLIKETDILSIIE
jgi:chaperonin GroES